MNITNLRKLNGWSQTDLAEAAGVEQPTISRIEGGSDSVTIRVMQSIADALDVPLYVLFLDTQEHAEIKLLDAYRSLTEERKRGWQDMVLAVKAGSQTEDQ